VQALYAWYSGAAGAHSAGGTATGPGGGGGSASAMLKRHRRQSGASEDGSVGPALSGLSGLSGLSASLLGGTSPEDVEALMHGEVGTGPASCHLPRHVTRFELNAF